MEFNNGGGINSSHFIDGSDPLDDVDENTVFMYGGNYQDIVEIEQTTEHLKQAVDDDDLVEEHYKKVIEGGSDMDFRENMKQLFSTLRLK